MLKLKKPNKNLAIIIAVVLGILGLALWAYSARADASEKEKPEWEKVTICHRTDSVTNPYQKITIKLYDKEHDEDEHEHENKHFRHKGVVVTSEAGAQILKDSKEKWGDIIPNELNWNEDGKAIWENDCNLVEVPVEPPVEPEVPVEVPEVIDEPDTTPVTTVIPEAEFDASAYGK